jgi:hypothetical protein
VQLGGNSKYRQLVAWAWSQEALEEKVQKWADEKLAAKEIGKAGER